MQPREGRSVARKATKVRRAIGRGDDIDPGIRTHIEKLATQSMISMNRVLKKAIRENEKLRAENTKLKARIEKLTAR
jgi:hypothetical protein